MPLSNQNGLKQEMYYLHC